ncbi:MAG: Usp domain-containing protein [Burkholderia sp.]|jgi:nucleotide-binding universal stress UspA family protein
MSGIKILVASDGSELSKKAIETAVELAMQLGGELVGMTSVVGPAPEGGFEAESEQVRERLSEISKKAAEKGVRCEVVAEHCDAVWKGILNCAAEHDVRFIVMASRGLSTIGSLILGSETQKVVHQADRPVLVVR